LSFKNVKILHLTFDLLRNSNIRVNKTSQIENSSTRNIDKM